MLACLVALDRAVNRRSGHPEQVTQLGDAVLARPVQGDQVGLLAPYEPEDEDLEALEGEISAMVAEIAAETAFDGVAFPPYCDRCSYAAICPDAARSSSPRSEPIVEIVHSVPW